MLTFQSSPKVLKRAYTITASLSTNNPWGEAESSSEDALAGDCGPRPFHRPRVPGNPRPKWDMGRLFSGHFLCCADQGSRMAPAQGLPSNWATGKVSSKRSKTKTTQTLGEAEVGRHINLVAIIKEFKKKTQAWLFFAPLICWASSYKPLLESSKSSKGNSEWPKAKPHQLDGYLGKMHLTLSQPFLQSLTQILTPSFQTNTGNKGNHL